jgi:DNA-directed RNA polymerase specialized sigma24 family protein
MSDVANEGAGPASVSVGQHDFRAFYVAFCPKLVGFLLVQCGRPAEAVEVAQRTMTRLGRRWSEIDHPAEWSRREASRLLVRRFAEASDDDHQVLRESDILVPSREDMERWAERHPILRAIDRFSHREKQVLAWTLEGYTVAEISTELSMEAAEVQACLSNAQRALAERLPNLEEECR